MIVMQMIVDVLKGCTFLEFANIAEMGNMSIIGWESFVVQLGRNPTRQLL